MCGEDGLFMCVLSFKDCMCRDGRVSYFLLHFIIELFNFHMHNAMKFISMYVCMYVWEHNILPGGKLSGVL